MWNVLKFRNFQYEDNPWLRQNGLTIPSTICRGRSACSRLETVLYERHARKAFPFAIVQGHTDMVKKVTLLYLFLHLNEMAGGFLPGGLRAA